MAIGWWKFVVDNWLVASGGREEEAERGADTTLKQKPDRSMSGMNIWMFIL